MLHFTRKLGCNAIYESGYRCWVDSSEKRLDDLPTSMWIGLQDNVRTGNNVNLSVFKGVEKTGNSPLGNNYIVARISTKTGMSFLC